MSNWSPECGDIRDMPILTERSAVDLNLDQPYSIQSTSPNCATLEVFGFGTVGKMGGIEIVKVTQTIPGPAPHKTILSIITVYDMVGLSAAAGIGLFFAINRLLKNKVQGAK